MSLFKAIGRLFREKKSIQLNPANTKSINTKPINMTRVTSLDNKVHRGVTQVSKTDADLIIELKVVRVSIAKREGIKPYMVFTDRQLNAIIDAKPISERELSWIEGFDEEKALKYGKEISRIFRYL